MFRTVADLARQTVGLIYPPACLVCGEVGDGREPFRHGLCIPCWHDVTVDPSETCPRCTQTVGAHTDTADGCTECRAQSLGFEQAVRLGPYDGRLRDAVLRMKNIAGEGLADLLGRSFAECRGDVLRAMGVDVVVPIPLHWWRKLRRGYNQSESVARQLAFGLGTVFEPRTLRRTRHTTQHAQSSRAARQQNLKGAFQVARGARVSRRTVLLVDDVMTTCSTASEAAKTLLAAGAEKVVVAVLARR